MRPILFAFFTAEPAPIPLFCEDTFVGRWRRLREAMEAPSMTNEGIFIWKRFFDAQLCLLLLGILCHLSLLAFGGKLFRFVERYRICFKLSPFYVLRPKTVWFSNQKHTVSEPRTYGFGTETIKGCRLHRQCDSSVSCFESSWNLLIISVTFFFD